LLFLAASLVLAACGKDAGSTSSGAAPAPATASTARPAATATAPAPAATATAAPAGGGACTFVGTWKGTYPPGPYPFSGHTFEITFNADGSGITHSERADEDFAWKSEGGTFSIHRTKVDKGGRFTCGNTEIGKYGFTFTPDCGGTTLKLTQDPCRGRAKVMDGVSLKRK
jgi:hypothetical protein